MSLGSVSVRVHRNVVNVTHFWTTNPLHYHIQPFSLASSSFFLHDAILPSVTSPSCRQTTAASVVSQVSLQTVPHCPPIQTSTLPSCSSPPPVSLMSVSLQDGPNRHAHLEMLVKWYEHCYHLSYLEHICSEPNSSRWLQKLLASNWHVRSLSSFAAVGQALERTTQVNCGGQIAKKIMVNELQWLLKMGVSTQ